MQANFGAADQLTVAGVPIGRCLGAAAAGGRDAGSVIGVVASDAPLLPHQLRRVAKRCGLGIARSGSVAAHTSGDIFLAFSTGNAASLAGGGGVRRADFVPDEALTPFFEAAVQAVDEAVINALVANETMTGRDGRAVPALPHDRLRELLQAHNRLAGPGRVSGVR